MNRLLYGADELNTRGLLELDGRRSAHVLETLKLEIGDTLRCGEINRHTGTATLVEVQPQGRLIFSLERSNESALPLLDADLVLALPRPKMARRVLEMAASLGYKSIHLINSRRVEKSYWQSHYLEAAELRAIMIKGVEQAAGVFLPEIQIHRSFRPFVEDTLPDLVKNRRALLAHPTATAVCPIGLQEPSLLIVGPEGGFIDFEVDLMCRAGAEAVTLGPRILRVETALPFLSGRLYTSK